MKPPPPLAPAEKPGFPPPAPGAETVWAPWRLGYILEAPPAAHCFLCEKLAGDNDRENLVLHRGATCVTMMNLYPYNNGHLLLAPQRHLASLTELTAEEAAELMDCAVRWERALRERMNPDGFNLGLNLGKVAGAGLEAHLHLHVVPRWNGDTNFLPVVSGTKVVSESLFATYDRLKGAV